MISRLLFSFTFVRERRRDRAQWGERDRGREGERLKQISKDRAPASFLFFSCVFSYAQWYNWYTRQSISCINLYGRIPNNYTPNDLVLVVRLMQTIWKNKNNCHKYRWKRKSKHEAKKRTAWQKKKRTRKIDEGKKSTNRLVEGSKTHT